MNRALTLLLPVALVAGGCAASKSARRPSRAYRHHGGGGGAAPASTGSATVASESVSDDAAERAPSDSPPAPGRPGPSLARRGRSGRAAGATPRRARRTPRAPRATTPGERKAAVAHGAQVAHRRMIIYKAHLTLRVLEAEEAMAAAQKVALENGAYLQARRNRHMVFRVPVGRFHALLEKLEGLGEVSARNINAQDVTQRFSDIKVRLDAAKAVLERLKALLAKAKNVQESLAIERQMARVIVKIERFKGQLRYLKHHASLSTISLRFVVRRRHRRRVKSSWKNPFGWVKGLGLWRTLQF